MINFNNKEDATPNALFVLTIAVLIGTLAYLLLVPEPVPGASTRGHAAIEQRLFDETEDMNTRARQAANDIAPRLWKGSADDVTAAVLAQLTNETQARSLKLTAFRPDRSQTLGSVTELKFDAEISGSYPRVRSVLAALDAHGSKVALRSVQIGASAVTNNGSSIIGDPSAPMNLVTATVGMSAYLETTPIAVPPPAASHPNPHGHGTTPGPRPGRPSTSGRAAWADGSGALLTPLFPPFPGGERGWGTRVSGVPTGRSLVGEWRVGSTKEAAHG